MSRGSAGASADTPHWAAAVAIAHGSRTAIGAAGVAACGADGHAADPAVKVAVARA
jgi:hypothetical protein